MYIRSLLHAKGDHVVTIGPDASVNDAVAVLANYRIGALVVSADGSRIDGIVSERDIIRELAAVGATVLDQRVSEVMTTAVRTCGPDATLEELMTTMTNGRFRHVPVVDGGSLRGIVSIGDVVKRRVDELETERRLMHEYLLTGR